MTDPDAWVPLAEIARPHGVRGELRLKLFNASSDVLLEQDEVLVRLTDGSEHEVSVERARRADDAILVKLHSVDDRDRADELRGAQICVRRRDFPPAEDGEFYAVDVVGAQVRVAGEPLGEVTEIVTYPTAQALVVRPVDGLGDWEIPLTDSYIANVDLPGKVVDVLSLDELERLPVRKPKKKTSGDVVAAPEVEVGASIAAPAPTAPSAAPGGTVKQRRAEWLARRRTKTSGS